MKGNDHRGQIVFPLTQGEEKLQRWITPIIVVGSIAIIVFLGLLSWAGAK